MARLSSITRSFALLISLVILSVQGGPPAKRSYPLPSVSDAHYQEILSDGSYKYAYTGEHRYVAERRLADGSVEGESLYIRPDGVPIKVHYFADGQGYRPKTEVLYKERLTTARRIPVVATRKVVVPEVREVVDVISHPAVVVAPPRSDNSVRVNLADARSGQGVNVASNGDVAAAVPSITAVIGPGSHAVISPEAEAHSGSNGFFRSAGGSGSAALANPQVTAIAGPGSTVVISPKSRASTGNAVPVVERVIAPHVVERVQPVLTTARKVVATHAAPGYVYSAPPAVVAAPTVTAVRAQGVLVIPPKPSYSYTYSYSAPDGKHPQRDNSAYVNVNVNH
ncbi:Endocuticle structural glycoprotein SgAbd-2 [Orchesella cincta]|uniref:Endocuticle structural glycoprotein SgAbd-2 n=1 Tax=Orchesella cincta TaxID=48709 RepID=A0A1D2NDZ2_ORCCI|nr:Endocuticle structural glycoprotein SgAbd-2 [Orchesella cincta]